MLKVAALAKVLRRGNIWCLNAGENYKVKLSTWWEFVKEIESTNVTVRTNEMGCHLLSPQTSLYA